MFGGAPVRAWGVRRGRVGRAGRRGWVGRGRGCARSAGRRGGARVGRRRRRVRRGRGRRARGVGAPTVTTAIAPPLGVPASACHVGGGVIGERQCARRVASAGRLSRRVAGRSGGGGSRCRRRGRVGRRSGARRRGCGSRPWAAGSTGGVTCASAMLESGVVESDVRNRRPVVGRSWIALTASPAPAVSTAAVTTPATALAPIAPPTAPIPPAPPPPSAAPPTEPTAPAPATPAPAARSGGRAAPGARSAEAEFGGDEALQRQQRPDRRGERRQRLLVGADLGAEVGAALALAHVAAHRAGDLAQPLGGLGQLQPHLAAGQLTRLVGLGERDPRPHQQRLDRRHAGFHRLRDLLVGEGVHLAQQQRRALRLRQLADVVQQLAELLAVVDLLRGRRGLDRRHHVHRLLGVGGRLAQVVEGAVAGDPVQPGPQVDLALVGKHRPVGVYEDLLQDVLGILGGAEHLPAEPEQSPLVAIDDRLVGAGVARPGHRDQSLVPLEFEQW